MWHLSGSLSLTGLSGMRKAKCKIYSTCTRLLLYSLMFEKQNWHCTLTKRLEVLKSPRHGTCITFLLFPAPHLLHIPLENHWILIFFASAFRHWRTAHGYMSRIVRKPDFCLCENKGADQLRGNREADQRLCFRYTDSIFPLLLISEISSF